MKKGYYRNSELPLNGLRISLKEMRMPLTGLRIGFGMLLEGLDVHGNGINWRDLQWH